MPSDVTPRIHIDEGNEPLVALLKSGDFGRDEGPRGELPYRLDLLRSSGLRLGWTDQHLHSSRRGPVSRLEAATVPFSQAWISRSVRRGATSTVAIFESEGHGLALARRVTRRRRPPLLIVACWLADLARSGGALRRRTYRWLYRSVDAVVVFSSNQRATLAELLDIAPDKVHVVRFGVDLEELATWSATDGHEVVAVGRDRGRDWATLASAARDTGWSVRLATRSDQVAGLELPPEISMLGRLTRADYLGLLAGAGVVVVPTEVREYPTGQTVLLEAMAMGKACVVTDTPAMREYVEHGTTALMVSPHDPDALREAVQRLLDDPALRERIGRAARDAETSHGGAAAMWTEVAGLLGDLSSHGE